MKLLTALVLILTLTLPALAEPAENIALDAPFEADLNGDGVSETLTWRYAGDGDGEDCLCLEVTSGAQTVDYPTAISHDEAMWLTDMGGPALVVTGHDEDGEGRTLVLRYTADGRIREVMFRADDREKVAEEYYSPAGYGILVSMSGDEITLEAQADVLGSWRARRGYVLNENDRFVFTDAPWQSAEDPENPDSWSFPALTTVRSLEYTDDNGDTDALQAGTQLLITETDKESVARFVTRDGVTGTLSLFPGYDSDPFNYSVGDVPETELFRFVPYVG